jgi:gas vesicle protein
MADGYDQFDRNLEYHEGGGGSFVMGLLTGTVLGAGLGMLFAPKPGSELRTKLSEQASEGYRRASESASQLAERGRDMYSRASDAVAKGAEEAKRYAAGAASSSTSPNTGSGSTYGSQTGSTGSGYGGESTYGGRSQNIRGSSTD